MMLHSDLRQSKGYDDGQRSSLRSRGGRGGSGQGSLVQMLRQRHPDALRTVMDKYNDKLFAVANRICRNPADSEEVLQDVYMTALNKIDSFEERSSLSTWLYRITVNAALMKLRAQRTSKNTISLDFSLSSQLEDEVSREMDGSQRSPLEGLVSRELHREIEKAVGTLPEIYKAVFLLRDVNGYSIKETSRILKTTPAAVKSRLHRSRQYLRERLMTSYTYN
jgi:RNA polymerase sigma-70 factor (ECF subfamily)